MAISKSDIWSKANSITLALEKMSVKEREKDPTVTFAEDYNRLRDLAVGVCTEDERKLLPPELKIE